MQIVSEKNLAHFLELKAKNLGVASSATPSENLKNLCFIYDDCLDNYDDACLDGYENFESFFKHHAQLKDGYYAVGKNIKALTFTQLNNLSNQCANYLSSKGLSKGDKIGFYFYNSFEFAILFFACFKLGLIVVPINALLEKSAVEFIAKKTALKYMVMDAKLNCDLELEYILRDDLLDLISTFSSEFKSVDSKLSDTAIILFTSGTTSLPKGCLITHYNLLYASYFTGAQVGFRRGDVFATSMPHWHIDLLATAFMPSLRANLRFVLFNRFSATRFWHQLVFFEANISEVVPKMIKTIMLQPRFKRERSHKLRLLLYFLNMSREKYLEFKERFGVDLFTSYGLSESIVGIIGDNHFEDFKFGAIGKVYFGVDVKIAKIQNNELIECKANELGEICIKGNLGEQIFAGYYQNDEANAKSFFRGYFLTGDCAYYDDDGVFYFHSRNKDLIKINGENVSAVELENKISDFAFVKDVSVICSSDEFECDVIVAFVAITPRTDAAEKQCGELIVYEANKEINSYKNQLLKLNENLASFKQIKEFIFIKELPYNHVGKVKKNHLGEIYGRI